MDGPEKTTIRYRISAPGTTLGRHRNNIKGTWDPSFFTINTTNYNILIYKRILWIERESPNYIFYKIISFLNAKGEIKLTSYKYVDYFFYFSFISHGFNLRIMII